ncbi:MAG: hypothetical protein AB1894_11300 [Chloroflexota bacterium]
MKRSLLYLLCLASLAACVPSAGPPSDPYRQMALVKGSIQATQAALAERAFSATLEAAHTAQAAQVEIDLLLAQAEATRQAFTDLQVQAEATRQAEIYQATATAQAAQTSATADAAAQSTSLAYPGQATATQAALNEIARLDRQRELQARWEAWVIPLQALLPSILWFTILVLLILGSILAYRRLLPVLEMRLRTVSRGSGMHPLFLFPDLLVDPSRSFGPALRLGAQNVESQGHAPTPELQAGVTGRAQMVEAIRAASRIPPERRVPRPPLGMVPPAPLVIQPPLEAISLPEQAPWHMLNGWQGGVLPLGLGKAGLVLAEPETNPHLLFAGATGSGKTRYGLRPLIASALADGWQVAIFDRSGLDFLPFRQHPNARLVPMDAQEERNS